MDVVKEKKELIQSEIPKLSGLDSKTVSIVTRDLEDKGLLNRKKILHQSRWTYTVEYVEPKKVKTAKSYDADHLIDVLGNITEIVEESGLKIIKASAGGLRLKIEIPNQFSKEIKLKEKMPISISLKINPKEE